MIGGSYAKGLTKKGYKVSAIDTDKETIQYALKNNIIKKGTTEVDPEMIGSADIVIFALYPHIFKEWIRDNQQYFKSGAIITDVTGVKGCVVEDVSVEHPVYGQLTGRLQLSCRADVACFLEKVRSCAALPLSALTEGIHTHRLRCPDGETLDRARAALRRLHMLQE